MISHRVKKAVVHKAELIAAVIPIHGLLKFLADVNGLLDLPGGTVWLFVSHCCLCPVNHMVQKRQRFLVLVWLCNMKSFSSDFRNLAPIGQSSINMI